MATCSSPNPPPIWSAGSRARRRYDVAGAQGVRPRRVPRVDRRTVPARLPVQCTRRHALHRGHVSRDHRAPHLDHRVPARSDRRAQAGPADRLSDGSIASSTTRRGATRTQPVCARVAATAGRRRCRIRTAGGATRRSGCSSSAARKTVVPDLVTLARNTRRLAHASACAVDARRARRDRTRRRSRRRWRTDHAMFACRPFASPSGGWRRGRSSNPGRRAETHRRPGLGRPSTTGRIDRRAAAAVRGTGRRRVLERYGDDPVVMDATLSGLRGQRGDACSSVCSARDRK